MKTIAICSTELFIRLFGLRVENNILFINNRLKKLKVLE